MGDTCTITISNGKSNPTYYTAERIAIARENTQRYIWAKEYSKDAIENANKFVDLTDFLWNSVTTQELPRGITVGYRFDTEAYKCRYCGVDLRKEYGYYPWLIDAIHDPWKIQCPSCKKKFPSNDFASFHQLGIDTNGKFNYQLAKKRNAELVINGQDGYLKNILYPEKNTKDEPNWGVDDGYGYRTGRKNGNIDEVHTYIAYYNHWGIWYDGLIIQALECLRDAYIFTGNIKYGCVGAILIDRIADIYPDMHIAPYLPEFYNSDGNDPNGKVVGRIWECQLADHLILAYDAFYSAMEEKTVVNYLSQRAKQYGMVNRKQTPQHIRENCENGILREIRRAIENMDIHGNFGMHQAIMLKAAVVLDNEIETPKMINWVFQSGDVVKSDSKCIVTGGNVSEQIINHISRDGFGSESSPKYNSIWVSQLDDIAETLAIHGKCGDLDLYSNPKYIKALSAGLSLTLCQKATAHIGDSGNTGSIARYTVDLISAINGYIRTKDYRIAQMIYFLNGNTVDGLHAGISTPNPEEIQGEVQNAIFTHGTYDFSRSEQLAGYGFSILRDETFDNPRDFWMYYGTTRSHGHFATLNLGIEAYGLNVAPELGYPAVVDEGEEYSNWSTTTVSHNTVVVNNKKQNPVLINGFPIHFDDSGRVKVMDVDAPHVYDETSIYRRTIIMIETGERSSYGVDFFRICGGDEHLYSFHSQSDKIYETEGLELEKQETGSYAGTQVPWKTPGYESGYAWLHEVRSSQKLKNGNFAVDFSVQDFRNLIEDSDGLHMRVTMRNTFALDEVVIAEGEPPQVGNNPEKLEFILARRSGKDLDTLFTTVFEPYRNIRCIKEITGVTAIRVGNKYETGRDVVRALKILHENGRVDYVIYASNNKIEYYIDGKFSFMGFVGVYIIEGSNGTYSYLNDGSILADMYTVDAYCGRVFDFTRELTACNHIEVVFDQEIDIENLQNKYIYVQNDGVENAVYLILTAKSTDGIHVILEIGDTTLIRKINNRTGKFIYNISEGQQFRIPLTSIRKKRGV